MVNIILMIGLVLKIFFAALVSKREKMYSGSFDVVRKTLKERGVLGMYRGVQVLLTGTIPTYAIR